MRELWRKTDEAVALRFYEQGWDDARRLGSRGAAPTITVIDEAGHVEIAWPDPPRSDYPVSHEVIAGWVERLNSIADQRARDERIIEAAVAHGVFLYDAHTGEYDIDVDAILAAADQPTTNPGEHT